MKREAKSRSGRKVKQRAGGAQLSERPHTRRPSIAGMKELVRKRWKFMSLVAVTVLLAGIWFMLGDRGTINIDTSMGPGWVAIESRDQEGRLLFPVGLVEGTAPLRWEDRKEEGVDAVSLFTGYHPSSVLGLSNKLYYVERVSYGDDDAWRRSAKITIHLPLDREYESEWFKNMGDKTLRIFSGEESMKPGQVLRVENVQFVRKEIDIVVDAKLSEKQRMFGATIEARESILAAFHNSTLGTMTKSKVSTFLGSLMAAVLAGLFVRWFPRRSREDAS